MNEGQPRGEQRLGELNYARDLFIQLFKDDSPLINLGYSARQVAITRPILRHLEEEGRLSWLGDAFFGEGDEGVNIDTLKHGGYALFANRDLPHLDLENFSAGYARRILMRFFEDEPEGFVAIIDMIPSSASYEDLDALVKGLYEGWYEGGVLEAVSLEKSSPMSKLKSHVLPNTAVFKATWVDEATKLELVVKTNYTSKSIKENKALKEYHMWRRLPAQESNGKTWIPFGRKPNVSNKRIREILETKKSQARVVLVPQPVKA